MKKLLSLFLILAQTFFSVNSAHAQIPFEEVGRFYGIIKRPDFNLEKAVALLESDHLKNARMYLDTDDTTDIAFPNKLGDRLRIMGFRGEDQHDIPQSYIALVLQRLFPSPDGMNMVPNQGSVQDPIKRFTPKTIGAILNFVSDFYETLPENLEEYSSNLSQAIRGSFDKAEIKSLKKINDKFQDFALSLVQALAEQRQPSDIWEPHIVENALFAFALMKAAEEDAERGVVASGSADEGSVDAESPFVRKMKVFYDAMPKVVGADRAYGDPFTYEEYEAVLDKVKSLDDEEESREGEESSSSAPSADTVSLSQAAEDSPFSSNYFVELTPREKFVLLFGLKSFAQIFPTQHFYSTVRFEGITFINCGEASLLNLLNTFLWDFKEKRLRHEILEEMVDFINPALLAFYQEFKDPADQFTLKSQQAWTRVVSGLGGVDPLIKYKKGEGTVEFTGGMNSILGVVRALFPDEAFKAITDCESCDSSDKNVATLDHLAELFSPPGESSDSREMWSWKSANVKEGEDEHQLSPNGAEVEFHKKGANLPVVDDFPMEGTLMTWTLQHGHYDCNFSLSEVPQYMENYSTRLLRTMLDEPDSMRDPLNLWAIGRYSRLSEVLIACAGVFTPDKDEPLVSEIFSNVTKDHQKPLIRTFLLHRNYRELEEQMAAFMLASNFEFPEFYRFAANVLELLPRGDTHANFAMLSNLVDESAGLKTDLPKLHPRITVRMEEFCKEISKPKIALDLLVFGGGPHHLCLFLLSVLAKGLDTEEISKEDVLRVIYEQSENKELEPDFWIELGDYFFKMFLDGEGRLQPEQFMLYRPDDKDSATVLENLLEEASDEVIDLFLNRGMLTKDIVVKELKRVSESRIWPLLPGCDDMARLNKLIERLHLSAKELFEAFPNFFNRILSFQDHETKDTVDLFGTLGLDMDSVLPDQGGTIAMRLAQGYDLNQLEKWVAGGYLTKAHFLTGLRLWPTEEDNHPSFSPENLLWIAKNIELTAEDLQEARPGFLDQKLRDYSYNHRVLVDLMAHFGIDLDTKLTDASENVVTVIMQNADEELVEEYVQSGTITKNHFLEPLLDDAQRTSSPYYNLERFAFMSQIFELSHEDLMKMTQAIKSRLWSVENVDQYRVLQRGLGIEMTFIMDTKERATLFNWLLKAQPDILSQLVDEKFVTKSDVLESMRVLDPKAYFVLTTGCKQLAGICKKLDVSVAEIEDVRPKFFSYDMLVYDGDSRALFGDE